MNKCEKYLPPKVKTVRFSVESGFAGSQQPHVFETFRRGHNSGAAFWGGQEEKETSSFETFNTGTWSWN